MVAHERLTESLVIIMLFLAQPRSSSNFPAFLDLSDKNIIINEIIKRCFCFRLVYWSPCQSSFAEDAFAVKVVASTLLNKEKIPIL